MNVVVFIPARYASSRFPGKPLAELTGATGQRKSLIRRSWDAAMSVVGVSAVHVLTDDTRIADAAAAFGASVLMTSSEARNGTERCAEAVGLLDDAPDLVINLQGDAPLTPPHFVEALIGAMTADVSCPMATPVLATKPEHLADLQADRAAGRVGATTAVFGNSGDALYFSKEIIPFAQGIGPDERPVFHHVGCYGYRPEALKAYGTWEPGPLELREGLEQLRFLENGMAVRCIEVESRGRAFWELNNPSDVPILEGIMAREEIE